MVTEPEPLHLEPRYAEAIWGGRRLVDELGKAFPADLHIGESWEVFGPNRIRSGRAAGLTLDELARQDPHAVLGSRVADSAARGFPLLVKLIDARLPLSVQVHPPDDYARQHERGSLGKTEAWYILSAPAGSELVYGLRVGIDREQLRQSVATGQLERDLTRLSVQPGEAMYVPAGTVHAIGAGILLYEVQQRSEITYRLYDWGRVGPDGRPRPLHVDRALAVLRLPQPEPRPTNGLVVESGRGRLVFLAACRYFALVGLEGRVEDACDGSTFAALTVVAGTARLIWSSGEETLPRGSSVVLPASLGPYRLEVTGGGRVLRSTVPDLERDVVAPLVAAGYSRGEISRLGDVFSA